MSRHNGWYDLCTSLHNCHHDLVSEPTVRENMEREISKNLTPTSVELQTWKEWSDHGTGALLNRLKWALLLSKMGCLQPNHHLVLCCLQKLARVSCGKEMCENTLGPKLILYWELWFSSSAQRHWLVPLKSFEISPELSWCSRPVRRIRTSYVKVARVPEMLLDLFFLC